MERWLALLQSDDCLAAWDEFIGRYRPLIFAAIRHSTTDPDTVMDVFAHVCEAIRADDLARLRKYAASEVVRAKFSTWLVTVVHHLTVDWFRRRDGRPQAEPPSELTLRQQAIYRLVLLEQRSHVEAFELLRQRTEASMSFRDFGRDLRVVQRTYNYYGLRPRMRNVALSSVLEDPGLGSEELAMAVEARARLEQVLITLQLEERAALHLFVLNDMPAADVARAVGWRDAKAVYNRVYRLLKKLRNELMTRGLKQGDL